MSRRSPIPLLLFLLPSLLASKPPATPPELVDFDWRGSDVVLVFSDSVGYEIDLAASDTSQVVLRLGSLTIAETLRQQAAGAEAPVGGVAISLGGRDGRAAALAQRSAGDASLRIHDDGRLGYSIEWRPFTHQLVVHTFDWDRLSYGESQFHQGLIALEQGATDQAEELLQVAGASGDDRANGVLASMFARRGADSLAGYFLRAPRTAEELAALAAIQERAGDSAGADESRARSVAALADRFEGQGRPDRGARFDRDEAGEREGGFERGSPDGEGREGRRRDGDVGDKGDWGGLTEQDVLVLAAIGGLALLLIIGLIVLATRRSRRPDPGAAARAVPPAPPPPRAEPTGYRVVERHTEPQPPSTSTTTSTTATTPASTTQQRDESQLAFEQRDVANTPSSGTTHATEYASSASIDDAERDDAEHGDTSPRVAGVADIAEPSAPWSSPASEHRAGASQADELRTTLRDSSTHFDMSESTIDAARRMHVSRDNVELRRLMDAARDRNAPE